MIYLSFFLEFVPKTPFKRTQQQTKHLDREDFSGCSLNNLLRRCASTLRVDRRTAWESTGGLMARRHQLSYLSCAVMGNEWNGTGSACNVF